MYTAIVSIPGSYKLLCVVTAQVGSRKRTRLSKQTSHSDDNFTGTFIIRFLKCYTFYTVGVCGEAGSCSRTCKYPHLKLLKCAKCKGPHHHVCDGETDDLSTCATCSSKHKTNENKTNDIKPKITSNENHLHIESCVEHKFDSAKLALSTQLA